MKLDLKKKSWITSLFIILITLLAAVYVWPTPWNKTVDSLNKWQEHKYGHLIIRFPYFINQPFSLGLDLVGGTALTYKADLSQIKPSDYSAAMNGLRDVIERRVNLFGAKEPRVAVEKVGDNWQLVVELAGITDIKEAIRQIGQTPYLEFREMRSQEETNQILKLQEEERKKEKPDPLILNEDPYFKPTILTGRYLQRADVNFTANTNQPVVDLVFNDEGAKIFQELTKNNIGKPLAIYLDGALISAPVVQEEISGGRAQISGKFDLAEAKQLAQRLNQGALPVPITLISQESIGSSLGIESINKSVIAGLISLALIILFMVLYYRLSGLVASLALLTYTVLSLALFKLIPITLTLSGIAGFILSIGMAVDANILIFERAKEEIRKGKNNFTAIGEGFLRAWPAIRDSNICTIISATILYFLTSSLIRGFALTLGLGVILSMFSAIFISRLYLLNLISSHSRPWLWFNFRKNVSSKENLNN